MFGDRAEADELFLGDEVGEDESNSCDKCSHRENASVEEAVGESLKQKAVPTL